MMATRPFIVRNVPAPMLRRNVEISKGARSMWGTMLSRADAQTGELRIGEHWLDGEYIQREAEVCDRLRKKYIRELVIAGYVKMERVRVLRVIRGRLREVLGETHYTVFREPQSNAANSSTVTFRNRSRKSPTNLSEIHQVSEVKEDIKSSSPIPADDCSPLPEQEQSEKLERFKRLVLAKCSDADGILDSALEIIIDRARRSGINVTSPKYLEVSLERFNFQEGQDLEDFTQWRRGRGG